MNPTPRLLLAACAAAPLCGQSFVDITETRNSPHPFASLFQIEAGAIGDAADETDPAVGLDDDISWDARVYYRDEEFSSRRGTFEAYAGRDGLFAGFADGKIVGDDTVTRFEFRGRPWQFQRDGFYRDDQLVPNGFYDGSDYEGYLGFGRESQGLYIETGPFYKQLDFARSDLTPVTYEIPDGYAAYGFRLYVEQAAVQIDRKRGMPRDGYLLTLIGEREWNDSDSVFGAAGFTTKLPSAVWRARGRIDWYVPASDSACWEIAAYGGWQDDKDRIQNTEGQRPLGNQWADAQIRLRLHVGQSMTLTPYFQGQYSRLLKEDGFSSSKDFFLGGGAEANVHFSEQLSMNARYSYLDNENRPSIRIDEDLHGQQMFYLGMVLRIGSTRR